MAELVPVIEMIRGGVVEVDRDFHQAQAEHFGVEFDIALGLSGDGGYVMYAPELQSKPLHIMRFPVSGFPFWPPLILPRKWI
jgi:hypothetical protein